MRCILLPIHPEWCAKILNGDKSIEVRRGATLHKAINKLIKNQGKAPCLIYCTKSRKGEIIARKGEDLSKQLLYLSPFTKSLEKYPNLISLNGKVVAEFEASAEVIESNQFSIRFTKTLNAFELEKCSCLTQTKIADYLVDNDGSPVLGTAIHIHGLKTFDKPKELKEFYQSFRCKKHEWKFADNNVEVDSRYKALRQPIRGGYEYTYPLTKAPQSWCYAEVEE